MFTKVEQLNEQLLDFPYVNGYSPSTLDAEQLANLPAKHENYAAIRRWVKHMSTFPEGSLPKLKTSPEDDKDDDDDIDLFGSGDDEEAEQAKAERAKQLEAQKSKGKPGVVAKSSIVLDVKVWDDETDLKEVEAQVRKITNDGLLWGAAKTVPLAFGVCKLQIVCVVEDAKVSVDWLTDQIEELELVQSTDIAAFQKI